MPSVACYNERLLFYNNSQMEFASARPVYRCNHTAFLNDQCSYKIQKEQRSVHDPLLALLTAVHRCRSGFIKLFAKRMG